MGMLEDHLHGATLCEGPFGYWLSGDVVTLPQDLPGSGRLQAHYYLRHGGFPRTGFPHKRDNLALACRKGNGLVCSGIARFPASPGERIVLPQGCNTEVFHGKEAKAHQGV